MNTLFGQCTNIFTINNIKSITTMKTTTANVHLISKNNNNHVYFTIPQSESTLSKISYGDWYIDDCLTIRQATTSDNDYWKARPEYEKIIACTDKLKFRESKNNIPYIALYDNVPYIPQQYQDYFFNNLNNNITIKTVELALEKIYLIDSITSAVEYRLECTNENNIVIVW